jgi:RNA polymerase sigma-70 factor (ECF subfamily)
LYGDAELVDRARAGDRDAFAELVKRYERLVIAEAINLLRCPEDARDVAQDVFVIAYRRLNSLWGPRRFGPWIMRIARNAALRYRNQRRRRSYEAISEELPDLCGSSSSDNDVDSLLQWIARLPGQERLVLMLRYVEGMTTEQIAQVTGRPIGTVTKQLSRARRRLKAVTREEATQCLGKATTSI